MTASSDPQPSASPGLNPKPGSDDVAAHFDSLDSATVARRIRDQAESAPTPTAQARPFAVNPPQGHWSQSLRSMDKWWTILLLLFGVTGVLGLPVLWVSRSFGTGMKWVLSVVVTLYTALLCWGVYLIFLMAYESIRQTL